MAKFIIIEDYQGARYTVNIENIGTVIEDGSLSKIVLMTKKEDGTNHQIRAAHTRDVIDQLIQEADEI